MAFISRSNGDLTKIFVTEAEIVDNFVGNQLWMWGEASLGRLGNNATADRSSPVQTVARGFDWKQVSAGSDFSGAIKTDGTLWMWGEASNGRLGTNAATDRSSPTQTIAYGSNWKQLSIGTTTSAAVKTDGTLWLWGNGSAGNIGNGVAGTDDEGSRTVVAYSSPIQTISTGTNWKQVSLGQCHSAAVKADGTLWLWGFQFCGALGNNSTGSEAGAGTDRCSPVQTVSTATNWKQVSLGYAHSAAIKTDGTLWLWGNGTCGRLGTESSISHSSPIQTISTVTTWKSVSLGRFHSSAIKIDGTLWLWGCGAGGRLGDNSTINQSSPVQTISTGTNWKSASSGRDNTAAIKIDGTLWLWGCNGTGQLGDNSTTDKSSPVQTVTPRAIWKQVSGTSIDLSLGIHMGAVNHTDN